MSIKQYIAGFVIGVGLLILIVSCSPADAPSERLIQPWKYVLTYHEVTNGKIADYGVLGVSDKDYYFVSMTPLSDKGVVILWRH